MFKTDRVIIINGDTGLQFNISGHVFGPGGASHSGYSVSANGNRLGLPKYLRMMRYPEDAKFLSAQRFPFFEGSPIVDVTVPVAERIPQDVLDEVRKLGGGLRLKLRIHPDTLLVGWDIVSWPGEVRGHKDSLGMQVSVPVQYSFIGGDFCERQVWNVRNRDGGWTRVEKKGWYIDPKTHQRIETNY